MRPDHLKQRNEIRNNPLNDLLLLLLSWRKYNWPTTLYQFQWLAIAIRYKMITIICLVICHHMQILEYNWRSFLMLCISLLWFIYFVTWSLYLLIVLTCFTHFSIPSSLAPTCLFSVSLSLFSFLSGTLFCFLDSTCK